MRDSTADKDRNRDRDAESRQIETEMRRVGESGHVMCYLIALSA